MYKEISISNLYSDNDISSLKYKINNTRLPKKFNGENDNNYGIKSKLMYELLDYWGNNFDLRKHLDEFDEYNHCMTHVKLWSKEKKNNDSLNIHFIYEKNKNENAIPLLLIHGWPGSVYEFHKAIPLLKEKFHLIIPSLPGYGWSDPFNESGGSTQKIAEIFNQLMINLGYNQYAVQGGDWGAVIAREMTILYPEVVAMHLNMPIAFPNLIDSPSWRQFLLAFKVLTDISPLGQYTLSKDELFRVEKFKEYTKYGSAYMHLQATKPETFGFSLSDSPAGLLAWITEKLELWTDNKGNLFNVLSKEEILTLVSIYWLTNSGSSSIRLYYETLGVAENLNPVMAPFDYISKPVGIASYPNEILNSPKRWCDTIYNVKQYSLFKDGGHFAAFEQPESFSNDVIKFYHDVIDYEKVCKKSKEDEFKYRLENFNKLKSNNNDNNIGDSNSIYKLLFFAPFLPVPVILSAAGYLFMSKL